MAEKKLLPYQRVHKCYLALMDALERCRYEEAVALAEKIREIGTRDRQIWYTVLAAYIDGEAKEKAAEASDEYRRLFDLAQDGTGRFLLGRIRMLAGDWEEAEKEVGEALQLPMADWYRGAAFSILANLQRKLARPAEAAENYLKSVAFKTEVSVPASMISEVTPPEGKVYDYITVNGVKYNPGSPVMVKDGNLTFDFHWKTKPVWSVTADPYTVDFGTLKMGKITESDYRKVVFTNTGNQTVNVVPETKNTYYTPAPGTITLAPGESGMFLIKPSPIMPGGQYDCS